MATAPFSYVPNPDVVDLLVGYPEPETIPINDIQKSFGELFNSVRCSSDFFQYSDEPGYQSFRVDLSDFLSEEYGSMVCKDDILLGAGCSGLLDLILTTLDIGLESVVLTDELTYFCALEMFNDRHTNLISVPIRDGQLDMESLRDILDLLPEYKSKLLYTVPTFNNPTGLTWSLETRRELIQLADLHDFYIASDEVYNFLYYDVKPPPPPLALLDTTTDGRVFSIGSFSKIIAPAVRLGWVHAKPRLIQMLSQSGYFLSGGNPAHINAGGMHWILKNRLSSMLLESRAQLRQKSKDFFAALIEDLPNGCSFPFATMTDGTPNPPAGGYFLILKLPDGILSEDFARNAEEKFKVRVMPTTKCGDRNKDCVRLCFAYYCSEKLVEGSKRIADAIKAEMLALE